MVIAILSELEYFKICLTKNLPFSISKKWKRLNHWVEFVRNTLK